MAAIKVAVLVGSLRKDSLNRRLARAVEHLAPPDWVFEHVSLDLPLYNQDLDADYPAPFKALKAQIKGADAVLIVTPEYNRSIPGVLKNALDIASRPYGTNAFAGKPGAVLGISIGALGTALAQQHLRNVLAYLDVAVLPHPEVYLKNHDGLLDAEGQLGNDDTRAFLQTFVDRYVAWVQQQRAG